ncbi:MAG: hypothetical protein J07HB67_01901 [halophilic archaeon J07HB67]|nr:MAG: hypothetical protein J07HB67_01901 [halophilic archaeon J07HB67]
MAMVLRQHARNSTRTVDKRLYFCGGGAVEYTAERLSHDPPHHTLSGFHSKRRGGGRGCLRSTVQSGTQIP